MLAIKNFGMTSFEKFLGSSTIFQNISVLSPHYIPKTLPYREKLMEEIMMHIAPTLKNQRSRNILIYGKTGTGKTCSIKKIMEEFERIPSKTKMHYLNCRVYNSKYRVLQKIMKEYYPELEKAGFGLPFIYEKLLETMKQNAYIITVLDEIDMVKDLDDLIYTLTRANDEAGNGGISIIGISNKLSFKENLDPRSKSSLNEIEIVFPPYTSEQLQKILEQRVNEGFKPGVVQQSAINLAAAITAQESGDARYALKLLMRAGEIAEKQQKTIVDDSDVEEARKQVETDLISEVVNTLPEMHKITLYAISKLSLNGSKYSRLDGISEGFLMSGEVYEEYEYCCKRLHKKPRSLRWYKEYLNDLEMLGLIITTPSSKGIRGQTTLIKLGHPAESVHKITKSVLFDGEGE
ncbi:MAG: AAA family ATPase [Candidatus Bilamarchaeaceae archaeon]